jgi:hypothetical protein
MPTISGNAQDVPVMPNDPRVTYKQEPRRGSIYIVRANPRPAPRPEPKDDQQ